MYHQASAHDAIDIFLICMHIYASSNIYFLSEKTITVRINTKLAIIATTVVFLGLLACSMALIYFCANLKRYQSSRQQFSYHPVVTSDDDVEIADDTGQIPSKTARAGLNGVTRLRKRGSVQERRARNKTM